MTLPADALKTGNGALFVQKKGPNTKPEYVGCVTLDDIESPQGDIELIRCFNPNGSGYVTVGQTQAPPDPVTTTITGLMFKTAGVLERLRCPFTLYALQMCGDGVRRDVFANYDRGLAIDVNRITSQTWANIVNREEDTASERSLDISGNPPVFEIFRPTVARQSTTETQALNDIAVCAGEQCPGQCDSPSIDLGQYLMTGGDTVAGSPGGNAEILITDDGGADWDATATDPFAVGEIVISVGCFQLDKNTTRRIAVRGTADAGNPAEIAYSDNDGATWVNVNVGTVNGQYGPDNNCLFVLDRNNIWLTTTGGYIYYSSDAGESWVAQESGVITAGNLNCVFFADENTGFAAGAANAIMQTTDGGQTWTAVTGPAAQAADAIIALTYSGRWWIGYNDGQLWYSENDGTTWTQRTYPGSAGMATLPDIAFSSDLCGYMLANTAAPLGIVLRTVDGGYTWEGLVTPPNAGLNALVVHDCNLAHAVGEPSGGTAVILKINAYPA